MEALRRLDYPPVWLALFIGLAWVLSLIWAPLGGRLAGAGWALVVAALALTAWAARAFRRARTTIVPHRPPSALVDTGPYRLSRNPIYLADLMILAGAALILGAPHALVLVDPFRRILLNRFILPEEAVLERDLGDAYRAYRARVPRWLGRPSGPH